MRTQTTQNIWRKQWESLPIRTKKARLQYELELAVISKDIQKHAPLDVTVTLHHDNGNPYLSVQSYFPKIEIKPVNPESFDSFGDNKYGIFQDALLSVCNHSDASINVVTLLNDQCNEEQAHEYHQRQMMREYYDEHPEQYEF